MPPSSSSAPRSNSREGSPTPGRGVPKTSEATTYDGKRVSANDGDDNDDDEVWDPAAETHPRAEDSSLTKDASNNSGTDASGASGAVTNNTADGALNAGSYTSSGALGAASSASASASATVVTAPSSDWQAIYSPAHNAYYFYNAVTQQTTWTNPLVPDNAPAVPVTPNGAQFTDPSAATAGPSSLSSYPAELPQQPTTTTSTSAPLRALPTADELGGIDPELAFLDPSLASSTSSSSRTGPVPTFTAKFNAHTGRFAASTIPGIGTTAATPAGLRDPNHVSEYERAKRMSEAYFDVDAWKQQVEEREAAKKARVGNGR